MKTLYLSLGTLFLSGLLATSGLAQRSPSRFSNYDAVTSYRIGTQGIGLGELNQALQQAGYGSLASQVPVFSIASQISRPDRALALQSEMGLSFGSGTTATNTLYKAKAGFWYYGFGASYSIIRSDKFQLGPQLGLMSIWYNLKVAPVSNNTPSLNSILTNPGSTQTATLRSGTFGLNAGITANLRIPYGSERQLNCTTMNRSFVIGLDAGYRFANRSSLTSSYEINTNNANPAIQFSGWYAGLRLGFGQRVRSTATAPVTH